MRVVSQTDPVWRGGGVGSGDVAALLGCGWDGGPLALWAKKVEMLAAARRRTLMRQLAELEQGTSQWHSFRRQGVGGSEVATVLNANPFGSAVDLWRQKTDANAPQEAENENMRRGKDLEPVARGLYENLFGWPVWPRCVIHDTLDYVRCSLDGIRPDGRLIAEIKCPNPARPANHADALVGLIRDYYRCQIQYQLLITGAERCHFVSYCPGAYGDFRQLAVVDVFPHPGFHQVILERVGEFWDYVVRRERPPEWWCEIEIPIPAGGC